jgi:hypothetical protein
MSNERPDSCDVTRALTSIRRQYFGAVCLPWVHVVGDSCTLETEDLPQMLIALRQELWREWVLPPTVENPVRVPGRGGNSISPAA